MDSMKLRKLYSLTKKALDDFKMIESGDRIAVGISGGKDSLALLYALAGLRQFYSEKFEIIAVTVDAGYGEFNLVEIKDLCEQLDVEFYVVKTEIAEIVRQKVLKGTYCSLCAKLRKGALNSFAKKMGCNKVAYAHHKDDLIETMMLSLVYEGQFFSFAPLMYYKEAGISVIRPLVYIEEAEIRGFRDSYNLPCVKNPCPHDGKTQREYVQKLIAGMQKDNPGVKDKMFHAILKGKIYEYDK